MRKLTFIGVLLSWLALDGAAQHKLGNENAMPLHRAEKALTDVIVHDVFSPPAASRIYAYANIAAYEILAGSDTAYLSLRKQLNQFPSIPSPEKNIHSSLAAVYSFLLVGRQLIFSDSLLQDSINDLLKWYKRNKIDPDQYKNSLAYGRLVADSIIAWSAKDHYRQTRSMRRYSYLKQEGKWIPTPPGYFAAVEPYWSKIRCLTLDSSGQFKPRPPVPFSKDSGTAFYNQAVEVYLIGSHLTNEQREIANFWDCNPFDLKTSGHLLFSSKKISPGGHWINITGLACRLSNASIIRSSAAYTLVSIALLDAFISCWDEKYRSNSIRPETFINKYVDETWRPLLQTPPFPEYTSGHSVISAASAVILGSLFGNNFSYTDNTETAFSLPARRFSSFAAAANEAAVSRLYGGIHYRSSVENGQEEGDRIGKWVLQKVRLKK